MAMAVGLAGSFGCAQQQLGGGPGADAGCGPIGNVTCAITGCTMAMTVAPVCMNGSWTCPADVGATIGCRPLCAASLPLGCSCDPSTGVAICRGDAGATCPADAPDGSVLYCVGNCSDHTAVVSTCAGGVWSCPPGTMDLRDCPPDGGAEAKDAGTCPPNGEDGSFLSCTSTCNIDSNPVTPICVNGGWACRSPSRDVRTCCHGTAPPGCRCDLFSSALVCSGDAGTDAASAGHGG
jgi:hypothetical protein